MATQILIKFDSFFIVHVSGQEKQIAKKIWSNLLTTKEIYLSLENILKNQ